MFMFLHVEIWQLIIKILGYYRVGFVFVKELDDIESDTVKIGTGSFGFEADSVSFYLGVAITLSILTLIVKIYLIISDSYYLSENALIY